MPFSSQPSSTLLLPNPSDPSSTHLPTSSIPAPSSSSSTSLPRGASSSPINRPTEPLLQRSDHPSAPSPSLPEGDQAQIPIPSICISHTSPTPTTSSTSSPLPPHSQSLTAQTQQQHQHQENIKRSHRRNHHTTTQKIRITAKPSTRTIALRAQYLAALASVQRAFNEATSSMSNLQAKAEEQRELLRKQVREMSDEFNAAAEEAGSSSIKVMVRSFLPSFPLLH